jgi:hypothetical protein
MRQCSRRSVQRQAPLLATVDIDIIGAAPDPVCDPTLAAATSAGPSPSGAPTSFAPGSTVAGVLCQYDLDVPADVSTARLSRHVVLTAVTLRDVTTDVQELSPSDELASCPPQRSLSWSSPLSALSHKPGPSTSPIPRPHPPITRTAALSTQAHPGTPNNAPAEHPAHRPAAQEAADTNI